MYSTLFELELFMETVNMTTTRDVTSKRDVYIRDKPSAVSYDDKCNLIITSPPEGVARYCFHPVCLSVCVCVRPIFGTLFLGY